MTEIADEQVVDQVVEDVQNVKFTRVPRYSFQRRARQHPGGGEVKTKQEFKDECDVTKIMERWKRDRTPIVHINPNKPLYGDFTGAVEFDEALRRVHAAEVSFAALPPNVRAAVDNDPAQFLALCGDPERHEELVALGLVVEPEPPPGEGESPPSEPDEGAEAPPASG